VGVLAVAKGSGPLEHQNPALREGLLPGKPAGDGGVVGGGAGEGLGGELPPEPGVAAPFQGLEHPGVVGGVGDGVDPGKVLGRGPEKGGPSDVNLLEHLGLGKPGPRGLLEGVEVHRHQVKGEKSRLSELPELILPREHAGEDRRVQAQSSTPSSVIPRANSRSPRLS